MAATGKTTAFPGSYKMAGRVNHALLFYFSNSDTPNKSKIVLAIIFLGYYLPENGIHCP
jgi:hypothetical protein